MKVQAYFQVAAITANATGGKIIRFQAMPVEAGAKLAFMASAFEARIAEELVAEFPLEKIVSVSVETVEGHAHADATVDVPA